MTKHELVAYRMNLPLSLKQRLEHEAVDNRRSLSAEIIARLEASFDESHLGAVQVVIDSSGGPISWEQIHADIAEVTRRIGVAPAVLNVRVITPEIASSRK